MKKSLKLNKMEIDALSEIGNVGCGNAATALSKMLNKKIGIDIPSTRFVPLSRFADEIGGAEKIVVSIYLQITGDLSGEALFLFSREGAMELVEIITGKKPGTIKIMNDIEESAFKEMSNIFTGSYLNALSRMLDLRIFPSVPHVATDMAQAIIDFALIKIGQTADEALFVKTSIDVIGHKIDGTFFLLFEESSLRTILDKLHQKYGVDM